MSKIIGLPSSVHDPSTALIIDGNVVFAMEEEKLTGIKSLYNQHIFPQKTLNLIKQKFDVDLHTCDHIAQARFYTLDTLPEEYNTPQVMEKIQSFSHHQCHAMGAYFTSGMEGKVLSVSHDGAGTRSRGKIYLCENGQTNLIHSQWLPATSSLAGLWGVSTEMLGWAHLKDEGKVVGLASHGKTNNLIYRYLSQCSYYENMDFKEGGWESKFRYICNKLQKDKWFEKEEKRADFAATLQKFVEDLMLKHTKILFALIFTKLL